MSEYNLMGQVTKVNTDKAEVQYSYDDNGNLIFKGTEEYT
ncbi:hypothetical protein INF28_11610 [Oscillospiraceae bacterium DSM 107454]|uniref:YD repeat-containing protein n=1 Tax=Ructibacterium gallinarum TaxID=2779355 RepID=A0A9D5LZT9_9FIRM|nr:hypothetical protein [Ructibacterium gallinarum]MBE5041103.1 hypothetical protein [Ructibacterium gallinarum]